MQKKQIGLAVVAGCMLLGLGSMVGCGLSNLKPSTTTTTSGASSGTDADGSTDSASTEVYPTTENGHVISEETLDKIDKLAYYINGAYLYGDEVDISGLSDAIYSAVVDYLGDPYSCYYSEEEYTDLKESTSGTYCGIGATMSQDTETGEVTMLYLFSNSPAKAAGLEAGDKLVGVKDVDIEGMDLQEIVSYIRGEAGTDVTITIYRESTDETLDYTITRQEIQIDTVAYEMMDDNVGYIAIYEFEDVTADQFSQALTDLESQGMESLVLDLRDNPGGVVDGAVNVLGNFLDDQLAVYMMDKYGSKKTYTTNSGITYDGPMVILINENSASASEIVTGCLQDYGLATVIGTTSFGKGIVQSVYSLGDGSGLKITTADYYTPNGRNIHGTGIDPDIIVEADADTEADEQLEVALGYLKGLSDTESK